MAPTGGAATVPQDLPGDGRFSSRCRISTGTEGAVALVLRSPRLASS